MANSFTADFPEIWAKEMQRVFYKTNVAKMIADTSFQSDLKYGDTLNRPYRSSDNIQKYTRGTAITIDDKTDTNEQLSINDQYATGHYIDKFDNVQSIYDLAAAYGKDDGVYLSNQVDADTLGEIINANSSNVVDDGTLGGTSGNGITVTTSNILDIFGHAKKKIQKQNVPFGPGDLFAVVSPEVEQVIVSFAGGRDTLGGDNVMTNGRVGMFRGFELYSSNQLSTRTTLAMATNPANTETVVINGVTFTFVTSIGTTAGNVLIAGTVDGTRANLVNLINAPSTTSANQVALSAANARAFTNLVSATNDDTANTAVVTYKGLGVLTVSETLGAAADVWTAALQKQYNFFGVKGAPVLVVQSDIQPEVRPVPDKLGKNYLAGVLYGRKTFTDNAKQMVRVEIASSTF